MCRSIKTLRPPFADDVTEADIEAAALQYVRKISAFRRPAPHNAEAFDAAVAAVAEAQRVAGTSPGSVTITHPAAWGPPRREALARAARAAGLPAPQLAAEPVAAASYFVGTVGAHVPVGACAVVYDFGAGTFDSSV